VALALKVVPAICDEIVPKPLTVLALKVPRPVMDPPANVTVWVPMVNVSLRLMFNTAGVPGATPVPTVKLALLLPDPAFRLTLLLSCTGLLVRLLIVTAEVAVGAPFDQLPGVSQAFDVAPDHVSGFAACAANGSKETPVRTVVVSKRRFIAGRSPATPAIRKFPMLYSRAQTLLSMCHSWKQIFCQLKIM
jgi:hypothetical protein